MAPTTLPLIALVAAQAADLGTTLLGELSGQTVEANPLMSGPPLWQVGIKLAVTAWLAAVWLLLPHQITRPLYFGTAGFVALVAALNLVELAR